jgi:hypothetical protein
MLGNAVRVVHLQRAASVTLRHAAERSTSTRSVPLPTNARQRHTDRSIGAHYACRFEDSRWHRAHSWSERFGATRNRKQ